MTDNVQLTRDGGAHWRNVTPAEDRARMAASKSSRLHRYATVRRTPSTIVTFLGDRAPHAFVTHDFGRDVETRSRAALPAGQPARSIRPDILKSGVGLCRCRERHLCIV